MFNFKTSRLARLPFFVALLTSATWVSAATPPDAVMAAEPLFSTSVRVPPNMVLDLSVEFPTTGAAYRNSFNIQNVYIGYWDPMSCYSYQTSDGGYYKRVGAASRSGTGPITCPSQWSGNFLNWAASSSIDMLRYAMTGGDRAIDTPSRTVLQRAVLQDDFYGSNSYFPVKVKTGNLNQVTPLVGNGGLTNSGTIYIRSCRNKIFFGSTNSGGSCSNPGDGQKYGPGPSSGSYTARIEVCTQEEGPLRSDLCFKYPNGSYKSVGTIQTYSEKMRFAAFGYLNDGSQSRYGGVLRAPMRYTGPNKFDANFNKILNSEPEWNSQTGVFSANPLNSTSPLSASQGSTPLSGVVNYLNMFGRTGAPDLGTYKGFDPVGELYYESIRYLQGKNPTLNAISGMTPEMMDGFPVYNNTNYWGVGTQANWDPVVASCQRNYVLTIGDLNVHRDKSLPGMSKGNSDGDFDRSFNDANFEPNTSYWTSLIGGFENKETISYTHPSGKSGLKTVGNQGPLAYNYLGGNQLTSSNIAAIDTGSNAGSFAWAGMAYWANTQKIRADYPDVRVQTFTIDVDEGGDGTIKQRKRGSAFYLAAKYGGFVDSNNDGNPFKAFGGVGQGDISSNTEWADGLDDDNQPKPANYFLASDPARMIAAIRRIFQKAATASGTTSGGAISGTRVTSSGSNLYVPQFSADHWAGSLLSYPLTYDASSKSVVKSDTPTWDSGVKLTGKLTATPVVPASPAPADRKIFTLLSSGVGVKFDWGLLDTTLKGHLNVTPYSNPVASDTAGQDRLAYLRGDRSKEESVVGGIFRTRDSVMGDIVNSGPLFVGAPGASQQSTGYVEFATTHKNRQKAVYVGANDGMLHAFDAGTGAELFAYVPKAIIPKLGAYTSPGYIHQPYVDGSPIVSEAQMSDASWKSVLVSGMGGGAKGVFALDVTNPAAFSATNAMWEFTGADDSDMGYVTQAPKIMKFRTAPASLTTSATYGWFAVVPSGFNNANADKKAALFLLSLDKSSTSSWIEGTNYHKIVLPKPGDDTMVNALSSPGEYAAVDGSTMLLYAGDTQGNLWKFDFTKAAPWNASTALPLVSKPLMIAQDVDGNRQPITVAPEIGLGAGGGAIVIFGTGKFTEATDLSNYRAQSMYGVYDLDAPNATTSSADAIPLNKARVQLQKRDVTVDSTGAKLSSIEGAKFTYGKYISASESKRRGWYFDFPASLSQGERQTSALLLSEGYMMFNTLIPNTNVCGAGGGGRSCAVNALTGLSDGKTCTPSTVGLLSAPILIQEGEGAFTSTDSFGRRIEKKKLAVINIGTGGGSDGAGVSIARPIGSGQVSQPAGRLNWRQIMNYKELKQ